MHTNMNNLDGIKTDIYYLPTSPIRPIPPPAYPMQSPSSSPCAIVLPLQPSIYPSLSFDSTKTSEPYQGVIVPDDCIPLQAIHIRDYMIWSIANIVLGLMFGLIAVMLSIRTRKLKQQGDIEGQIASWKIRIALEEKQLQGYKSIMIIQPDQIDKNDHFWKNNEYGIIPSLRIQDITLNGVLPILLFLETSIPSLLPESSLELKGHVLERAFESLEFQRVCSEDLISYFLSFDNFNTSFIDTNLREKREKKLFSELIRWNDYITQVNPVNYIAHTSFTLADILFFPELALAVQFGLSLDYFSSLNIYYETLSKRPSIHKTWPYHWLHTNIKYDWLSNINQFAMFNTKQQKLIESTSHKSIDQDKNENIELLSQSSEKTKSLDDKTDEL
ncbi:unnamed protein product [Rotaria sordida]|uniref:GST C-terminal domain-containing protein n=1 Tax=Rotaria sordida TaxID=392033 RepID=A0A814HPU4_9BILA|nr:unnamed protein product [Rotaria sordida]